MNLSYWERSYLEGKRDVVIVGAGLVGLAAALEIRKTKPNYSILVVDKASIGTAASTRNAGFACFGSVSEIVSDIQRYGDKQVHRLVNKRRRGIEMIKQQYNAQHIEYSQTGGYEVFYGSSEFEQCENDISNVNELLEEDVFSVCRTPAPLATYEKSIINSAEGQLNTAKFYYAVYNEAHRNGISISNGIAVDYIDYDNCHLACSIGEKKIELSANRIIIATNALTKSVDESLDVVPVRNQVIITEPIKSHGLNGCFHLDRGYVYFRNVGERVLIGGARNLFDEEKTSEFGLNSKNKTYLIDQLKKYILPHVDANNIKTAEHWSGILSGGDYRIPIVRRVSDRVTMAVRLGGMGVAIGLDIGREAATLSLSDALDKI